MNLIDKIDDYMLTYSYYTIYHRAVPYLLDGLKPSQRCIMEVVKNINSYEKSNTVAGKVMLIHPHGDSYPTIVNMVQKDNNNYPLILGKGSFSGRTTRDGVPASSRYTECKVSEMGKLLTQNKDEVDYIPSYDNKTTIPVCFSPDLPMILINGQQGIATGFSINIPQYNLIDVCTQTINLLQGKPYTHIFPDFSTGGYINNSPCADSSSMRYTLRGKYSIDNDGVTITEIPYYTTREEIIEKIEELTLSGVMKSVKDVEDLTGKDGLCIYISLKRGANVEEFINQLCSLTSFQSSFTTNIGYIHNNSLVYTGVEELLRNWIELKTTNIIKGAKKKLENIEEKLEISEAFRKTVDCIKDLPKFILDLPEEKVVKELMDKKDLTEKQAIFISELGIKYFRENYFYKKINEAKDLRKEKDKLLHIVKTGGTEELIERLTKIMETWGNERKTVIENITLSKKELPKIEDNYKGYIYLTKNGFIYKTNVKSPNLTPGDEIINVSYISKPAEVLIFDKVGDCHKFYTEDIENCGKSVGYYTNVEDVVGGTIITETTNSVLLVYEDGRVARVEADSFRTATKRKKLGNSLYLDAKLIHITPIFDEDVVITLNLEKGHQKIVDVDSLTIKKQRNTRGIQLTKRKIIGVN